MNFISLAMLEDLQTDTAQALYLLMNSMILNKEGFYELPVDKICEHIGIEIDQRPSRIKSKACDQLIKTEIISDRKFHTDSNKTMYLRLYPTEWFRTLTTSITPLDESEQLKLLLTP
jgi:predicted metalloprotease